MPDRFHFMNGSTCILCAHACFWHPPLTLYLLTVFSTAPDVQLLAIMILCLCSLCGQLVCDPPLLMFCICHSICAILLCVCVTVHASFLAKLAGASLHHIPWLKLLLLSLLSCTSCKCVNLHSKNRKAYDATTYPELLYPEPVWGLKTCPART